MLGREQYTREDIPYLLAELDRLTAENAAYKADIAAGRMIPGLPYAIGDEVYWVSVLRRGVRSGRVREIVYTDHGCSVRATGSGATEVYRDCERIFATRVDAEAALAATKEADPNAKDQ